MKKPRRLVLLALLLMTALVWSHFPSGVVVKADELPDDVFELDQAEGVLTEARCYFTTGARGDRHKYCGFISMKADLPGGLVTDEGDFVYLIIEPRKIASYVEARLRVRGRFLTGTRFLRPELIWIKRGPEWERIAVRN